MSGSLYFVDDGSAGPLCWFSSRREAVRARAGLRRTCGWECKVEPQALDRMPLPRLEWLATLDGADELVRRAATREIAARART